MREAPQLPQQARGEDGVPPHGEFVPGVLVPGSPRLARHESEDTAMTEMGVRYPRPVNSLGYQHVGKGITVDTEDVKARGALWQLEFQAGKVKIAVKSEYGLLFFTLHPDALVYVELS